MPTRFSLILPAAFRGGDVHPGAVSFHYPLHGWEAAKAIFREICPERNQDESRREVSDIVKSPASLFLETQMHSFPLVQGIF